MGAFNATPVFFTDSRINPSSKGLSVRMSTTSTLTPAFARTSEALIDSKVIYDLLEKKVIPEYMNHDEWIWKMKNAISLAAFFNTHRMIEEYAEKAYKLKKQPLWKFVS